MKQVKIMVLSKRKIRKTLLIITFSSIGIYLLISLYFFSHFLFQTEINGINVSLKAYKNLSSIISDYVKNYELLLIERSGETELMTSHDIEMRYYKANSLSKVNRMQNPFLWISSLFRSRRLYVKDLYNYNKDLLDNRINSLNCLNGKIVEPRNVDFIYYDGSYIIVEEIYGNKINKIYLEKVINKYIAEGRQTLDLSLMSCYESPKYIMSSEKTISVKNQLDKYVSARIRYLFGNTTEQLDGTTIHHWLNVDENLEVTISKEEVAKYINVLSKKYNTVGILREFSTSTGKKVDIKGGLYGWKIDEDSETEELVNNIKQANVVEKEPLYIQKAFSREGNEIGNTYVEINISKQQIWFYKDGKLIAQGSVVTGNPNKGYATVLGAYMLNYKQKDATLTGPGYEAKVTYWMPFFGSIGLHDATWRYRFGGEIYKTNGSHGCVNAPFYLAKTIFENIEDGTPVIVYEE